MKKLVIALALVLASSITVRAMDYGQFKVLDETYEKLLKEYTGDNKEVMGAYAQFCIPLWHGQRNGFISEQEVQSLFYALYYALNRLSKVATDESIAPAAFIYYPLSLATELMNKQEVYDLDVLTSALLWDNRAEVSLDYNEIATLFGSTVRQCLQEVIGDKSVNIFERKKKQLTEAPRRSDKSALLILAEEHYSCELLSKNKPLDMSLQQIKDYYSLSKIIVENLANAPEKDRNYAKQAIAHYLQRMPVDQSWKRNNKDLSFCAYHKTRV